MVFQPFHIFLSLVFNVDALDIVTKCDENQLFPLLLEGRDTETSASEHVSVW